MVLLNTSLLLLLPLRLQLLQFFSLIPMVAAETRRQMLAQTTSSLTTADFLEGGSCSSGQACRREALFAKAVVHGEPVAGDDCGVIVRSAGSGYDAGDTEGYTLGVLHSCESAAGEALAQGEGACQYSVCAGFSWVKNGTLHYQVIVTHSAISGEGHTVTAEVYLNYDDERETTPGDSAILQCSEFAGCADPTDCEGESAAVEVVTYDSYGDGWIDPLGNATESAYWELTGSSGRVKGTLLEGHLAARSTLCLAPGEYDFSAPGGVAWPDDVSWELCDSAGYAGEAVTITVAEEACFADGDVVTVAPVALDPPGIGDDSMCDTCATLSTQMGEQIGVYYEPECDPAGDTDDAGFLHSGGGSGCGVSEVVNEPAVNCRFCIVNRDIWAELNPGARNPDWPDCPCCVADYLGVTCSTVDTPGGGGGFLASLNAGYVTVIVLGCAVGAAVCILLGCMCCTLLERKKQRDALNIALSTVEDKGQHKQKQSSINSIATDVTAFKSPRSGSGRVGLFPQAGRASGRGRGFKQATVHEEIPPPGRINSLRQAGFDGDRVGMATQGAVAVSSVAKRNSRGRPDSGGSSGSRQRDPMDVVPDPNFAQYSMSSMGDDDTITVREASNPMFDPKHRSRTAAGAAQAQQQQQPYAEDYAHMEAGIGGARGMDKPVSPPSQVGESAGTGGSGSEYKSVERVEIVSRGITQRSDAGSGQLSNGGRGGERRDSQHRRKGIGGGGGVPYERVSSLGDNGGDKDGEDYDEDRDWEHGNHGIQEGDGGGDGRQPYEYQDGYSSEASFTSFTESEASAFSLSSQQVNRRRIQQRQKAKRSARSSSDDRSAPAAAPAAASPEAGDGKPMHLGQKVAALGIGGIKTIVASTPPRHLRKSSATPSRAKKNNANPRPPGLPRAGLAGSAGGDGDGDGGGGGGSSAVIPRNSSGSGGDRRNGGERRSGGERKIGGERSGSGGTRRAGKPDPIRRTWSFGSDSSVKSRSRSRTFAESPFRPGKESLRAVGSAIARSSPRHPRMQVGPKRDPRAGGNEDHEWEGEKSSEGSKTRSSSRSRRDSSSRHRSSSRESSSKSRRGADGESSSRERKGRARGGGGESRSPSGSRRPRSSDPDVRAVSSTGGYGRSEGRSTRLSSESRSATEMPRSDSERANPVSVDPDSERPRRRSFSRGGSGSSGSGSGSGRRSSRQRRRDEELRERQRDPLEDEDFEAPELQPESSNRSLGSESVASAVSGGSAAASAVGSTFSSNNGSIVVPRVQASAKVARPSARLTDLIAGRVDSATASKMKRGSSGRSQSDVPLLDLRRNSAKLSVTSDDSGGGADKDAGAVVADGGGTGRSASNSTVASTNVYSSSVHQLSAPPSAAAGPAAGPAAGATAGAGEVSLEAVADERPQIGVLAEAFLSKKANRRRRARDDVGREEGDGSRKQRRGSNQEDVAAAAAAAAAVAAAASATETATGTGTVSVAAVEAGVDGHSAHVSVKREGQVGGGEHSTGVEGRGNWDDVIGPASVPIKERSSIERSSERSRERSSKEGSSSHSKAKSSSYQQLNIPLLPGLGAHNSTSSSAATTTSSNSDGTTVQTKGSVKPPQRLVSDGGAGNSRPRGRQLQREGASTTGGVRKGAPDPFDGLEEEEEDNGDECCDTDRNGDDDGVVVYRQSARSRLRELSYQAARSRSRGSCRSLSSLTRVLEVSDESGSSVSPRKAKENAGLVHERAASSSSSVAVVAARLREMETGTNARVAAATAARELPELDNDGPSPFHPLTPLTSKALRQREKEEARRVASRSGGDDAASASQLTTIGLPGGKSAHENQVVIGAILREQRKHRGSREFSPSSSEGSDMSLNSGSSRFTQGSSRTGSSDRHGHHSRSHSGSRNGSRGRGGNDTDRDGGGSGHSDAARSTGSGHSARSSHSTRSHRSAMSVHSASESIAFSAAAFQSARGTRGVLGTPGRGGWREQAKIRKAMVLAAQEAEKNSSSHGGGSGSRGGETSSSSGRSSGKIRGQDRTRAAGAGSSQGGVGDSERQEEGRSSRGRSGKPNVRDSSGNSTLGGGDVYSSGSGSGHSKSKNGPGGGGSERRGHVLAGRSSSRPSSMTDSGSISSSESRSAKSYGSRSAKSFESRSAKSFESRSAKSFESRSAKSFESRSSKSYGSRRDNWSESSDGGDGRGSSDHARTQYSRQKLEKGSKNASRSGSRNESRNGSRNDSRSGSRNESRNGSRNDSRSGSRNESRNKADTFARGGSGARAMEPGVNNPPQSRGEPSGEIASSVASLRMSQSQQQELKQQRQELEQQQKLSQRAETTQQQQLKQQRDKDKERAKEEERRRQRHRAASVERHATSTGRSKSASSVSSDRPRLSRSAEGRRSSSLRGFEHQSAYARASVSSTSRPGGGSGSTSSKLAKPDSMGTYGFLRPADDRSRGSVDDPKVFDMSQTSGSTVSSHRSRSRRRRSHPLDVDPHEDVAMGTEDAYADGVEHSYPRRSHGNKSEDRKRYDEHRGRGSSRSSRSSA